ncbi:YolD-like protein [Melghirimyces profundicolus]|uniref:YolD-like protein n=1 Tax=Melghirimyces profundicolus TaxID=1242148 RepID=A0A2T6BXJ5_9BACL|nr:YolD-like family protein [Melghirimyces profundicolus]PTX60801.1 YolD-like protein [Melghirimyces profundicolus]
MNVKALERGNKLWEGHRMMLPEHEAQLWQERKRKEEYRPPELAPDALEEIGRMIEWSKLEEKPIVVTYASKYGPKKYLGHVVKVDPVERWLVMRNGEDKEMLPFSIIIGAEEPTDDA